MGPKGISPEETPFPLSVADNKRYLVDKSGKPFFIQGDAAWSLMVQPTREDVDLYLRDRRSRGFNTLLVSLIEHQFSDRAPANADGEAPFKDGDYSKPNEAYFKHVDWVLRRAAQEGFLVLLVPSYIGAGLGDQGWYRIMAANGAQKMHDYGRFLGRRYGDFDNILWTHGGDADPPDKSLVSAIAEGIRECAPRSLHTAHMNRDTAALPFWGAKGWLNVNTVYTYGSPVLPSLEQYRMPGKMPFFFIEGVYEHELSSTEQTLRDQAYQAVLSGAAGHVFGSNPIWHFGSSRGLYQSQATWKEALNDRGTQSMVWLHRLLTERSWWMLEPDLENRLLTDGIGSGQDRAVAAKASDGSFALVYLPEAHSISIDLSGLKGQKVSARWYDPSNGAFQEVAGSPFPVHEKQDWQPPHANAAGFPDWVLVLEALS